MNDCFLWYLLARKSEIRFEIGMMRLERILLLDVDRCGFVSIRIVNLLKFRAAFVGS